MTVQSIQDYPAYVNYFDGAPQGYQLCKVLVSGHQADAYVSFALYPHPKASPQTEACLMYYLDSGRLVPRLLHPPGLSREQALYFNQCLHDAAHTSETYFNDYQIPFVPFAALRYAFGLF